MRIDKKTKIFGVTTLIAAIPNLAFGHAGHHGEAGLQATLMHVAQSPFHIALLGIAVAGVVACAVVASQKLKMRKDK
ncbi:MAG: hypothetical protein ABJO09_20935 [Hyphomicrobiales bacterium]